MVRGLLLAALLLWPAIASAQVPPGTGGGQEMVPVDRASQDIDRKHADAVAAARALGLAAAPQAEPGASAANRSLQFPLRVRPHARGTSPYGISNFVDHDTGAGLRDFACGERTYNGHRGIDIFPFPNPWTRMDNADVEIVAAAPGTLVQKQDGQNDRQCTWAGQPANYVILHQDDGVYAYYWHMKTGSVTTAAVGSRVATGDYLGIVGSSGVSTGPHLHFEMRTEAGATVDPFAGACNNRTTVWKHQWPAQLDPRIVEVSTSFEAPVSAGPCSPTIGDDPKYRDSFSPGATVYGVLAMRDQRPSDQALIEFVRPDGTIAAGGLTGPGGQPFFRASRWWRWYVLPQDAASGVWKVRGTLGAQVVEHAFLVGQAAQPTQIYGAVLPSGRSVRSNSVATMFATILNAGNRAAHGCSISVDTPIDAEFSFQTTDPVTQQLTGQPNRSVTIPAGSAQSFLVAFHPRSAARADAWLARLRFRCTGSPAAQVFEAVNAALISFNPSAVPDIIAIAVTPSNDQVIRLANNQATGIMAAAAVNIGQNATLTVRPRVIGGAAATATICRSLNGQCASPATASVSHNFQTNMTATFGIFVTANGNIPFEPGTKLVMLEFVDSGGVVRGQSGAAVTTAGGSGPSAGNGSDGY